MRSSSKAQAQAQAPTPAQKSNAKLDTFYKVESPRHGPIIQFQGCLDTNDWCTVNTPLQADVGSLGDDIFDSYDQAANSVITNVQVEIGKLRNNIEQYEQSVKLAKHGLEELEAHLATLKKNGVPLGGHHLPKKG